MVVFLKRRKDNAFVTNYQFDIFSSNKLFRISCNRDCIFAKVRIYTMKKYISEFIATPTCVTSPPVTSLMVIAPVPQKIMAKVPINSEIYFF